MNLLIDLGNTRLKWALYEAGMLINIDRIEYSTVGLLKVLEQQWLKMPPPNKIVIASVSRYENRTILQTWLQSRWNGSEIQYIHSTTHYKSLSNAYAKPERLGVDRWLNLIALYEKGLYPALIIDAGTAMTLDVLDEKGSHSGGLIFPGVQIMMQALLKNTALRFEYQQEIDFQLGQLADNTEAGIQWGVHNLYAVTIQQLYLQYHKTYPHLQCILTGGDAEYLAPTLDIPLSISSDLVFEGLKYFV